MRIGELAARTGLTAPTIRYYEQLGLLPGGPRPRRAHRIYSELDVQRLDLLRQLRDLLGVSLEELQQIAAAEEAGAALPERFQHATSMAERLQLVDDALLQADTVLARVRTRAAELAQLEQTLQQRRHTIDATRITSD